MAETAVRTLRTLGLSKKTDALSTTSIKDEYQDIEALACTQDRIKMPRPKLKFFGTNCGMNATANTAAFTLVKFVSNPTL